MTDDNNDLKKLLNAAPAPEPDEEKVRRAADAVWHRVTHPKPRRNFFSFSGGGIVPASIMIIAVLFGGLSYTVTQSTRSGAGDTASETNLISSAQLTQYPAGIRTSVVRMLINGIKAEDLVFDAPEKLADLPSERQSMAVFLPAGGNATHMNAPADIVTGDGTWRFNAALQIEKIGNTSTTGNNGNDIVALLPHIAVGICRRINEEIGLPSAIPDSSLTLADYDQIQGLSSPFPAQAGQVLGGALSGLPFACFRGADGIHTYYHVLIER